MTTASTTTPLNDGLEYPSGLLETLPVVPSAPLTLSSDNNSITVGSDKHASSTTAAPPPIRLLPPNLFTSLHLQHLLSHPPDHVLFPFLHGLEGDNDAQNTFFGNASAGSHWVVGVEVPVHVPLPVQVQMKHGHFHAQPPQPAGGSGLGAPEVPAPQTQMQVQHHQLLRPKVPRYRGLVWVVCEEDVRNGGDKITLSVLRRKEVTPPNSNEAVNESGMEVEVGDDSDYSQSSSDEDDGDDEEADDDDDDDLEDLDFGDDERDPVSSSFKIGTDGTGAIPIPGVPTKTKDELSKSEMDNMPYMHPVISPHLHPAPPQLTSINTSFANAPILSSTPTSSSSSGSDSLETETVATSLGEASTAPTSVSGSPLSAGPSSGYPQVIALEEVESPPPQPIPTTQKGEQGKSAKAKRKSASSTAAGPKLDGNKAKGSSQKTKKDQKTKGKGRSKPVDPSAPPLLTCTFRPKELLRKRRVPAGDTKTEDGRREDLSEAKETQEVWEFVPARVPDGISLRNFGIQMPIYATLSDIVVYSPKGPTPATVALAQRFREAIWRKRKERVETLKGIVYTRVHGHGHGNQQHQQQQSQQQGNHFIKIEDVLKAEREGRAIRKAKGDSTFEFKSNSESTDTASTSTTGVDDTTVTNNITSLPIPSASSPTPSLSDSEPSVSDEEDEEEEDLETRMLDTAERYMLSLVEDDLLTYNVFVLDADEQEMREEGGMAHLMMRNCGAGVPGGVDHGRVGVVQGTGGSGRGARSGKSGAHTIGSDGELKGERAIEEGKPKKEKIVEAEGVMDIDADADSGIIVGDMDIDKVEEDRDGDVDMVDERRAGSARPATEAEEYISEGDKLTPLIPNTVEFALREKEEMRDLTKASEIISLFPSINRTPTSPTFSSTSLSGNGKAWSPTTASAPTSPPHLQHLSGLIPPPSRTASGSSSSSSSASPLPGSVASSHRHHLHGQPAVEYTFTHTDPTVDISSPATFYDPLVGQVYLGNSGDVPLAANAIVSASGMGVRGGDGLREEDDDEEEEPLPADDPFNYQATNDPANGFGYDICIECHELAPFPTPAHVRAAEEHLGVLEVMWKGRCVEKEKEKRRRRRRKTRASTVGPEGEKEEDEEDDEEDEDDTPIIIPPRPPPHANAVVHLPFPSSPPNTQQTMAQLIPVMRFLEKWIKPVPGEVTVEVHVKRKEKATTPTPASNEASGVRRWSSSVASLMPSVFGGGSSSNSSNSNNTPPSPTSARSRSFTTPAPSSSHHRHSSSGSSSSSSSSGSTPTHPTRPLKLLLYSADGYTESSLAALCLLMSVKGLTLPEAYLDLQVSKRRSFFVYAHDLGVVRRVESRLLEERERERERAQRERERQEMERMVREAREREARERMAREQQMMSLEESSVLNANGKRTIGSVHATNPNANSTAMVEKGVGASASGGSGGGLSLFKVFGGSGGSAIAPAAAASSATPNSPPSTTPSPSGKTQHAFTGRPAAKSVSFSQAPAWGRSQQSSPNSAASSSSQQVRVPPTIPQGVDPTESGHVALRPPEEYTGSLPGSGTGTMQQRKGIPTLPNIAGTSSVSLSSGQVAHARTGTKRPRANTSPWLPSFFGGDHQSWFNDPRFDGSFPSRVLPFLYLGNLNHASNVYMLHALGITHVVSVGESALLPPPYHMAGHLPGSNNVSSAACPPRNSAGSAHRSGHGSLWIEEREGRIKVLDIKGVCDDGIDTLEPQLEPICEWIDKAREEGGQVLVHCRVGVSRSATVTIAYVMKHLSLPLVDAYLIVRSRRLSVLIQPNMRLLYNLCGWEVKLAKERAGWVEDDDSRNTGMVLASLADYASGDDEKMKERKDRKVKEKRLERELARTLTWPYLSMEVHKLNEKYLH